MSVLCILPNKIKASCSDSELIRLSNLAKNVQYSYTYDDDKKLFTITFSNLTNELKLVNYYDDKEYVANGEINIEKNSPGNYKFEIYSNDNKCTYDVLISKYVQIPYLNRYKDEEQCKGIEDFKYCSKWLSSDISYETWNSKVNEYRNNLKEKKQESNTKKNLFDQIREFYIDNYYIVLPSILVVVLIAIYIKDKKDSII